VPGGGGAETFGTVLNSAELSRTFRAAARDSEQPLLPMPPTQGQKTETEIAVFSSKPNQNRPTLASMKP